jgi:pyruvate,orthophosphate dikinase
MQDLEFTIERGKLYLLQCRSGKRSPAASFKIAVDQATKPILGKAELSKLVKKKLMPKKYAKLAAKPILTKDEAIRRIKPQDVERLFLPRISPEVDREQLAHRRLAEGINAVSGAACGKAVFTAARAEEWAGRGEKVILVRKETSPEDVGGMHAAQGILTATGGKTSHAAVVARGWGKCCIVGCGMLRIQEASGTMSLNGRTLHEGATITLDGGTGEVFDGEVPLEMPDATDDYRTLMTWCDSRRRLKVRTNADTPKDAARAVELGAEGIGLCRTEHMFFNPEEPQRLLSMRQMILAANEQGRRAALEKLLPYQQGDFEGIFQAMDGKPVTIRLIDPPLHEFLPHDDNPAAQQEAVDAVNSPIHQQIAQVPAWELETRRQLESQLIGIEEIRLRVDELSEFNPMLGHRGCRLLITYPEILDMQVRAIIQAAINVAAQGVIVLPEIMIPLTIDGKELSILVDRTRSVAQEVMAESNAKLNYLVGTMIETPRAAITADVVADSAEFFSFGTNDLTQTTMGLSRDDAGRFLPEYVDADKSAIFSEDPFQSIDLAGVGYLMRLAVDAARSTKPKIKLGICGEHGGDPASIEFCDSLKLDYVSCSPLRVPIARLAAAQSVINAAEQRKPRKPTRSKNVASPSTRRKKTAKRSAPKKKTVKKKTAKKKATRKTAKKKSTTKKSTKKTAKKAKKRAKKSPGKTATTKKRSKKR